VFVHRSERRPVPEIQVETLGFRHIGIVHDEYAVSPDGMKVFGVLDLATEMEGCRFSIGLTNSRDKSMRLAMTCGYRVFVCSNMAFSGDFTPVLAKHSKSFSLFDCISVGVDRMQRDFEPMRSKWNRGRGVNSRMLQPRSSSTRHSLRASSMYPSTLLAQCMISILNRSRSSRLQPSSESSWRPDSHNRSRLAGEGIGPPPFLITIQCCARIDAHSNKLRRVRNTESGSKISCGPESGHVNRQSVTTDARRGYARLLGIARS
jgi:hypothetical protein